VHWRAILVKSVRVDGEPRHVHIAYLGGIAESDIKNTEDKCKRRPWFWKQVLEKLNSLRISPEEHNKIIATIAKKISGPIPTTEQMRKLDIDLEYEKFCQKATRREAGLRNHMCSRLFQSVHKRFCLADYPRD
jgi:hypothetical protein